MRVLGFIILCMWPLATVADVVTMRTGWHPTFTRIVLSIPTDASWRLGQIDQGYGVIIDGTEGFDTSGFFARLPNDRITNVAEDDGVLRLGLDCVCHATAFLWRPDRLVIDINDGSAPEGNAFDVALIQSDPALPSVDLDLLPRPRTRVTLDDISPLAQPAAPPGPDLSQIEAQIIAGLTRAADQGLLQIAGDLPAPPVVATPNAAEVEMAPVETFNEVIAPDAASSVLTRTSVDAGLAAQGLPGLAARDPCRESLTLDVENWAAGNGFSKDIAAIRTRIYGEFDRVDESVVTELARAYLYYGFGREAAQTLSIDAAQSTERVILREMALIIDDDDSRPLSIAGQWHCSDATGLWGVLATPIDALGSHDDVNGLVLAFKALPDDLRRHLTPRMAARLVALGESDAAENLLGDPMKQAGAAQSEAAIVVAEIAADRGDVEAATETLAALANNDSNITPQALLSLIDLQLNEGIAVDPAMIALLEAKRFEYRDDPIDVALAQVHVRALVQSNAFGSAIDTLRRAEARHTVFPSATLAEHIASEAAGRAEDMAFLSVAFDPLANTLPGMTGNAVAQRLLDLGFPDRAQVVLRPTVSGDDMAERRYLRATAAMDMDDAVTARTILAGMNTDRAAVILSGDPDLTVEDSAFAWRNGAWSDLATGDDPLLRTASALALRTTDVDPDRITPLATGRALIDQSGEMRETVTELLARFDRPSSADN